MAIVKRPPGEAGVIAQAGQIVGKAEREKEERARADRIAAEQTARNWELQKMILNSQQDFAHEQRIVQANLNAEARSQEWQVEKMELASRIDFQTEEKQRAKIYERMLNSLTDVDEREQSGELSPERANDIRFLIGQQNLKYGFSEAYEMAGLSPEYLERLQTGVAQRPTKPETLVQQRRELEAVVGPEIAKFMSLEQLKQRVREIQATTSPTTETKATPPTPEELRALGTQQAYEWGKKFGYWK